MLLLPQLTHQVPVAASGLEIAMDQPFFPGKIILWLLFMLSLMSWAVMISKMVSLKKFSEGDRVFTNRLRKSKTPLEVHEKGWSEPMSLRQEIYNLGAKETAFQLLGATRLAQTPDGESGSSASLREALHQGEIEARARMDIGMSVLHAASAGAPFLGLLGMVWIFMGSFGTGAADQISTGLSGGLAVMAIGLIAATPAIFGQIFLKSACRTRMRELAEFRIELMRLFERALATPKVDSAEPKSDPQPAVAPTPATSDAPARSQKVVKKKAVKAEAQKARPEPAIQNPQERRVRKKVFKPVRPEEPMINPIAMQTNGAQS